MDNTYKFHVKNPSIVSLGYMTVQANTEDKHDRSAPSHYHWKILKCRMIIFSNSSILACPDKRELQQVHIIFNKLGEDYDKLVSLFLKFSLIHDGTIKTPTSEEFQMCFNYTLTAKLAPLWNTLGHCYLINNRDFLTSCGPQDGVKYNIYCTNDLDTIVEVKPVKIHFITPDEKFYPGELIRVLPSLNKAVIEDYYESLPETAKFKCYKDLRRHWKNIHGYRLPEEEGAYFTVRFWRGEPLTYPKLCLARNFPIITPVPKSAENTILKNFVNTMKSRMSQFLGQPMVIDFNDEVISRTQSDRKFPDTQAISLCTPTQRH